MLNNMNENSILAPKHVMVCFLHFCIVLISCEVRVGGNIKCW